MASTAGRVARGKEAIVQFNFPNQFSHSTAWPFKATFAHTLSVHSEKTLAVWATFCELPGVSLRLRFAYTRWSPTD
jgi:hypothetical protein